MLHKKFCETWYTDTNDKICKLCKTDPVFVERVLKQKKIKHLENQRRLKIMKNWPCEHAIDEFEETRKCCVNKEETTRLVNCSLYNETVERNYCDISCTRQKKININITSHEGGNGQGIGDTLQGLWAVWGMREKHQGREIVYYCSHPEIAKLSYPNSKHSSEAVSVAYTNLNEDYTKKLESRESFIDYYCKKLDCSPKKPPMQFNRNRRFHHDENYILIFPFAAWGVRSYPVTYYYHIAYELCEMGYNVVLAGAKQNAWAFKNFDERVKYYYNLPPLDLVSLVYHSELVICNDSMPAHLCGILDVDCVAIHTQLSKEALYKYYETITSITNSECNSCHWKSEKYKYYCSSKCWSLKAISPIRVLEACLGVLDEKQQRASCSVSNQGEREICNLSFPV